jgi:hypothetical protein
MPAGRGAARASGTALGLEDIAGAIGQVVVGGDERLAEQDAVDAPVVDGDVDLQGGVRDHVSLDAEQAGELVGGEVDRQGGVLESRSGSLSSFSAPGRIRTCDPRLRRPPLCPTELRALDG